MSGIIVPIGGGTTTIININQKKIEEGKAFTASYTKQIASEASLGLRLHTGVTKRFRFNLCLYNGIKTELTFYEGTTFSAAGTVLTPSNMNLSSAITPTFSVYYNPAVSANGTAIIPSPGSDNGRGLDLPAGQTYLSSSIIIGDTDTEYYFDIADAEGSGGDVGFILYGWEE